MDHALIILSNHSQATADKRVAAHSLRAHSFVTFYPATPQRKEVCLATRCCMSRELHPDIAKLGRYHAKK